MESGPEQMVYTITVTPSAAMATTAKRPKWMPSLLRALAVNVSLSRLDTRAIDVLVS